METAFLPDNYWQIVSKNVLGPRSPLQLLKRQAAASIDKAGSMVYPFLAPAVDRVTRALENSPDIIVLVFVLVLVVVALQILAWAKRVMVWWTKFTLRLLFWAVVVAFAAAVWQRGIEASLRDAVVIGSKIVGYAAVIKDIWIREYQRYEAQTKSPPGWRPSQARGRTGIR